VWFVALIRTSWSLTGKIPAVVIRISTIEIRGVKIAELKSAPIVIGFKILPHLYNVRTIFKVPVVLVVFHRYSF